jgi:hypothetical protein
LYAENEEGGKSFRLKSIMEGKGVLNKTKTIPKITLTTATPNSPLYHPPQIGCPNYGFTILNAAS